MNGYYERWYSEHWYFDSDPAGIFVSKRIENGGRTFDKGKVGMLIIVFRFAENTKGETDFIRAEV